MHVGLDRRVTRGHLALIGVEEFEVLAQYEEVLGAVMPGQRVGDGRLRGLAPMVPMLGQDVRVGLAGEDVAKNAQAGDAGGCH